ncbi:DUF4142 domain-containing protein [Sphingosinicella terrae]|uniref:DUF4142 domain-containing protein n=1 Tax=Sphingosinicella terrae TaxID=2172047 RepID=UPI000E0D5636|nr:DUF4142 domain-containing protein [Sphingosinicella terrae]
MKALVLAIGAAALSAACATNADDAPPASTADAMSPTSAPGYLRMAASSDMFEIESSRLALQQSQNPAVRQFAQMMINDHTRTTNEATAIARQQGMNPPPPMMAPHHQQMLDELRAAGPANFDSAYKRAQIAAHQEALNLHQGFASGGDNEALRGFAQRTVPAIQMHYQHAQSLPESMAAPAPAPSPSTAGERG